MKNLTSLPLIFFVFVAVYFCAVKPDVMEVDAAQYASMSREMAASGSYLQVYEHGNDYLDKPPFLFWASSISISIFGANNFGYKFPSILFAIIAIFATYRFTKLFYEKNIALLAAIVLASCQAVFLITNDVRTDTILMSWVIIALWQLAEWVQSKKTIHFIVGCIAIGFGMMTKGPIALFVPVFAFGSHFVLQRKFNYLFKPVYLLGIAIIAIVLLPMSIGLYQQFDLHPEKTAYGLQHISGLRFFYWTQSFGRITGESAWNNNATFSFLFENLLWGLLPWTLFFIAGLINELVQIVRKKFRITSKEEFITTGGFVLTYCSLGISKYQLPHYIYVALPLIAVITAKMIDDLFWKNKFRLLKKILVPIQWIICIAMLTFPFVILIYFFPSNTNWPWFTAEVICMAVLFVLISKIFQRKSINVSLACITGLNIFLSLYFYPNLMQYQASSVVGKIIAEQKIEAGKFVTYKFHSNHHSLHFYSKQIVKDVNDVSGLPEGTFILTMNEGFAEIQKQRKFKLIKQGRDFGVSRLNGSFLNKNTRAQQGQEYYLLQLQ